MQNEVRDKSVALAIKVGKTGGRLTADLLKWAIRKYLAMNDWKGVKYIRCIWHMTNFGIFDKAEMSVLRLLSAKLSL